jgi:hypothetical protein
MGAKAREVASLARGTCHRRSLRPFSRPSERFLDGGSRGFGAECFLGSREECLIDLDSGSPRHVYTVQNDYVHSPPSMIWVRQNFLAGSEVERETGLVVPSTKRLRPFQRRPGYWSFSTSTST